MENIIRPPGASEPTRPGDFRLSHCGSLVARGHDPRDVLVEPRRRRQYEREEVPHWGEVRIDPLDENDLLRYLECEGLSKAFRVLLACYQTGLIDGHAEYGTVPRDVAQRAQDAVRGLSADYQREVVIAQFTRDARAWLQQNPEPPR